MNKNSINENQAIQEGLERFLELELLPQEPEALRHTGVVEQGAAERSVQPLKRELKTEFATPARTQVREGHRSGSSEVISAEVTSQKKPGRDFEKSQKSRTAANKRNDKKKDKNKSKSKKKDKKKTSKWKKFLIALLVLAVIVFGVWYSLIGKVYKQMKYEKVQGLASEPMKQDGVTNVLLIGNDSREKGNDGRSDAMILLSISKETKTIHMTSLLRDMYVDIPGHDGNRLNAAYAYGGPALLCETIEQNFGIEVNRYVLVNFQAFAALVDAVGGIDMEVTNEEVQWINAYLNEYNLLEGREMTTDYLDTSLSGEIHLNGPQALAYSRNRYIGTDFGRTERQRKVLSAVIKKLPVAFATGGDELLNELLPNLTTNLTQMEVFGLSGDAGKLLTYEIIQTVIPADGTYSNASIRGMSVLEVDFEANKKIIQKEIYGKE
nr:LCP family protein [Lachnospiraceae bacterium]